MSILPKNSLFKEYKWQMAECQKSIEVYGAEIVHLMWVNSQGRQSVKPESFSAGGTKVIEN